MQPTARQKNSAPIQKYARVAGIIFIVAIVSGTIGEAIVPAMLVVPGDAVASSRNILANDLLFRLGFVAYIVEALTDVALTFLLYILLRRVHANLAFASVLFRVLATATFAAGEAFYFAQVLILKGDSYLSTFTTPQLQSLALLSYNVFVNAGNLSSIFYGVGSIIIGYLIWRSRYLPRILGVLWIIGGLGFVVGDLVSFVAPSYSSSFFLLPMIVVIAATGVWLLIRGVDIAKWNEREIVTMHNMSP